MTTTVASIAELTALTGKHLGYCEWREITQEPARVAREIAEAYRKGKAQLV